ncbi:MAG TPA: cytochrome c oxidase subunit II [Alphaproteobacteria bacterium]|jgi:cytochrome c oxidase subunit 2|nr:cytochrome c oxidase subunit II [Alphaproteobacteria bacterium]
MRRTERLFGKNCPAVLAILWGVTQSHYVLADLPASYLHGNGSKAYPVVSLTWGLLAISIAVTVIVCALLVLGIVARRARTDEIASTPVGRSGGGMPWLVWGTGISTVALFGSLVWTVAVLADINGPPSKPTVTIEVTGQQWWWKARYLSDDASRTITTANEIHIPVGQPIRIKLIGADVIHSFWVPALTGKTDTIPGQTNTMWLEADKPGIYRGPCTEYCGAQHAHMTAFVVADPPDAFKNWWDAQITSASAPTSDDGMRGQGAFVFHCGACHTVRGTEAGGTTGPELTHLMTRQTIAAGTLDNTPSNLAGWISNPQALKPGTTMPAPGLSGREVTDITAYLETLR